MNKLSKMMAMAVSLGLLSLSNPASAQENNRGGMRQEKKERSEGLKAKLNLSPEQSAMFDKILQKNREDARKQMMALPPDANPIQRREIMQKSMQNTDTEVLEILDSEQQALYKAEKEKAREEFKGKVKEKRKQKRSEKQSEKQSEKEK